MIWSNNRLRLLVTDECNINCFYCHNEGQAKGHQYLSQTLFNRIMEMVTTNNCGLEAVTFSGGEALLHPNINIFIEKISKYCKRTSLVTNGLLLDNNKLRLLSSIGVSKIRLGIDSIVKKKYRPSKAFISKIPIEELVQMIKENQLQIELNIVLTKYNKNEIQQLIGFCLKHNISAKFFEHVNVLSFGNIGQKAKIISDELIPFDSFNKNALEVLNSDVSFGYSEDLNGANYVYEKDGIVIRYCHYLCDYKLCHKTGTRIDSNGFVYVCMGQRGKYQINSIETLSNSVNTLEKVTSESCSS